LQGQRGAVADDIENVEQGRLPLGEGDDTSAHRLDIGDLGRGALRGQAGRFAGDAQSDDG
jgi:hypothetical protein